MLTILPLAERKELAPLIAQWFVAEWPEWYGKGGHGNATEDAAAFASSPSTLPVGLVAFEDNTPVGVCALKAESLPTHRHLSPWAAAGLVLPSHRGMGIGASMLEALVRHAHLLGFGRVYCGTATAANLLRRAGWSELETIHHEGQSLVIFSKHAEA
jgi:GNAT superfamily N-acetyltransferase